MLGAVIDLWILSFVRIQDTPYLLSVAGPLVQVNNKGEGRALVYLRVADDISSEQIGNAA